MRFSLLVVFIEETMESSQYNFPDNKRFAFTILDDTDDATTENVAPIYDYLTDKGIFISKTVWPLSCPEGSRLFFAGKTLSDADYLKAVKRIEKQGHEIAFHCATMESSDRKRTEFGLEFLKKEFSVMPKVFCNHGHNKENIYWGTKRFRNPLLILMYKIRHGEKKFYGDVEESTYFWGDLHRKHFKYTRNLTFTSELNVRKVDPYMPYHDSKKEFANYWFSTADAQDVEEFEKNVTKEKIDQLEREGGVCILSTHLGKRFCKKKEINSYFQEMIEYIADKPGWFVPVGEILDFLLQKKNDDCPINTLNIMKLEWRYLIELIRR